MDCLYIYVYVYVYVLSRHKAILDYLNAGGFSESFGALQKETQNEDFIPDPKTKYAGLLEKKWTSVIRLQKKVICQDFLYISFMILELHFYI